MVCNVEYYKEWIYTEQTQAPVKIVCDIGATEKFV